jgi:demethylmenaquinone methyltransferase/2-methoxy-6-polyprenyl-1,4-benzoquinol methylase
MALAYKLDSAPTAGPSRHEVWRMFDQIAGRYDFLNHALSLNRDKSWRRRLASHLADKPDQDVLDLATGTADQLLALWESGKVGCGVGLDLASKMMAIGQDKIESRKLEGKLALMRGDALTLPFKDSSFDAVTISFGIRNMPDVPLALREIRRILRPDGRALILEFSLPASGFWRRLYLLYFRRILPRVGGLISGDGKAYGYLNETVETFPYGDSFCRLMADAGFRNTEAHPLTFGIATIYRGDR